MRGAARTRRLDLGIGGAGRMNVGAGFGEGEAMPLPMPEVPPVMTTVLPAKNADHMGSVTETLPGFLAVF